MQFNEIMHRITGFSVPIFGASWNQPKSEIAIAREVVTFLEDRRVLYVPSEMEVPEHCIRSILEIRAFLTSTLQTTNAGKELTDSLRAMRAACRKFLNDVDNGPRAAILGFGAYQGHWANWKFNGAIGEPRGVFGIHIAQLAAKYGLDVEGDLASILPGIDDTEPYTASHQDHSP